MSGGDDWAPGDLALCVKRGRWTFSSSGQACAGRLPVFGQLLTVSWAGLSSAGRPSLAFDGYPGVSNQVGRIVPFQAIRFRKIRPLTDAERDEFLADIKQPGRIEA